MGTSSFLENLLFTTGLSGIFGAGIYSSVIERHWLDVHKISIPLDRLPGSFDGFRIVLLSDIHLGFFYSVNSLSLLVKTVNDMKPDAICLAGDLVDSRLTPGTKVLEQAVQFLSNLRASYGKLAVLGNHDYRAGAWRIIRTLDRGGFRVLINDHTVLQKGQDRLYFSGVDDVLRGRPKPERALWGIPENSCTILLVHEPDYANYLEKYSIDLQLSGHSHGGQVRLPFLKPPVTTRMGKKYPSGFYKVGNMSLYTTRGLGTTILPLRFFCRPEITVITLKKGIHDDSY